MKPRPKVSRKLAASSRTYYASRDEGPVEPPLSHYKEFEGDIYGIKHFDVEQEVKLYPDMKEQLQSIEDWVNKRVKLEQLEDATSSYKAVIEPLKEILNIHEATSKESMIRKISDYIKTFKEIRKIDKLKKYVNQSNRTQPTKVR